MKFIVKRTSDIFDNGKPCEGAVMELHDNWETRTCNEREFNKKFSKFEGLWRSKGKNHKITEDGCITRQVEDSESWTIEIKTLEELDKFIKDNSNRIVIDYTSSQSTTPVLEIYDDYRE